MPYFLTRLYNCINNYINTAHSSNSGLLDTASECNTDAIDVYYICCHSNHCHSSRIGLCSVLRPHQHSIGYMGDGFYSSRKRPNQQYQSTDAAPPPFRPGNPALCGSRPLVTPYYCRLGDLLCYIFVSF